MSKGIKWVIGIFLLVFTLYNSVYFKPLDEVKAAADTQKFSPASFAQDLMQNKMPRVQAFDAEEFYNSLQNDFDAFVEQNGKKLGVSNYRYFMLLGEGKVVEIGEENVKVDLLGVENATLRIATDFIFGNALRDASGLVSISDYANTMDFNNISVEMNRIVINEVIPPFVGQVEIGQTISFKGAIRINIEERNWDDLRLIPVELNISNSSNNQ